MSKVTIIIPSYNQQNFLPESIDSALAQTTPCEVIVIDDGSTDGSLAIAKGYESKGVKVISQVNKGLPSARNTGIMNATGEFILPLDSDDMLLDNCVERLLAIQEETNADIVSPSFKHFGLVSSEVKLYKDLTIKHFCVANFTPYFSLFRKSKLLEIGGYSPRMLWGYEDYHLMFNLLSRGAQLVTTQEILVLYRIRENSMLKEAQKHHVELINQIQNDFPSPWGTL